MKKIALLFMFFVSVLFGDSAYQDNISKALIEQDNQFSFKTSSSNAFNSGVFYAIQLYIPTADLSSSINEVRISVHDINTKQMINNYVLDKLSRVGANAVRSNPPAYNYDLYQFYRGTIYEGLSERHFDASLTTCELKEKTMARIQSSGQYWFPTNDHYGDLKYEGGKKNYWIVISANQHLFNLIDNLFPENNCTEEGEEKDGDEGNCKVPTGSYVIPKTREFHEDIDISGSDITLHYASPRVSGYKNALYPYIVSDIANGWTLSILHHYDNQTLFLGNGEVIEYKDYEVTVLKSGNTIVYDKSHMGHEFDTKDRLIRSFDPKSNSDIYTFTYDKKSGLLTSIEDRYNRVIKLNRDGNGKVLSIQSAFGHLTYLDIDSSNNLISVSYEDGSNYRFDYNDEHLLISKTNPRNYTYRYEYNTNGRVSKTSNPLNQEYAFSSYMQSDTAFSSFTTPAGDTYSYSNAKTDSQGVQFSTSKNPSGLNVAVSSLNDKRDVQKSYCGITEKLSYDIDELSLQNRLSSITKTMPSGLTNTQTLHTSYKKLTSKAYKDTSTITSNGKMSTITTDYLLGIQTITTPEDRKTTTYFDTKTYMPNIIDRPSGLYSTIYTYNSKKQLTSDLTGARLNTYSYDSRGNLIKTTNSISHKYEYSYDNKDRLISVKNPNNIVTYYEYDDNDNLISVL
ncbi:MAG: hypothetical protein LBF71_02945, partial [Campylobacteraceae bacterium]|nr:hypothetical protein [Campylobacteraceae bacterium]